MTHPLLYEYSRILYIVASIPDVSCLHVVDLFSQFLVYTDLFGLHGAFHACYESVHQLRGSVRSYFGVLWVGGVCIVPDLVFF